MKVKWPALIIILLAFLEGIYYYPKFPAEIASHWGQYGEVNGYMSKFWGLFLLPIIILALYVMFVLIPSIDPKKQNILKFKKHFDYLIYAILIFMFYINSLTIYWNLGHTFNMIVAMVPAMALLFFFVGVLLSNAEPNWFIGIRTPWTLSNDVVWKKTHQLGGVLYKISALISLLGLLWQSYAFFILIGPIILSSLYLVVYSYFEYRKLTK